MSQRFEKDLTKQLLVERPKATGRCQFCGAPARGSNVCPAHSDLVTGWRPPESDG